MNVRFDVLEFVNNPPSPLNNHYALVGKRPAIAFDEHHSEVFFEPRNMSGDVALHGSEGPSSARKRAMIGNCDQAGKVANLHTPQDSQKRG